MLGKVAIGLFIVLAMVSGAFWYYFQWSQNEMNVLVKNNAVLTESVNNYQLRIESITQEFAKQSEALGKLNRENSEIRKRNSDLEKLFAEHDFHNLTKKKPGLIENRINKGTKQLFSDLENITDPETYK